MVIDVRKPERMLADAMQEEHHTTKRHGGGRERGAIKELLSAIVCEIAISVALVL